MRNNPNRPLTLLSPPRSLMLINQKAWRFSLVAKNWKFEQRDLMTVIHETITLFSCSILEGDGMDLVISGSSCSWWWWWWMVNLFCHCTAFNVESHAHISASSSIPQTNLKSSNNVIKKIKMGKHTIHGWLCKVSESLSFSSLASLIKVDFCCIVLVVVKMVPWMNPSLSLCRSHHWGRVGKNGLACFLVLLTHAS